MSKSRNSKHYNDDYDPFFNDSHKKSLRLDEKRKLRKEKSLRKDKNLAYSEEE